MHMISQKSYIGNPHGGWFSWELKFLVVFLALISFSNLIFSDNTFALYTPTLSASVDQANLQVNGNQVINSTDKTTEVPLNLIVNTNNKTGYTAILNSETDETALVNAGSTSGAKIDSIDTNKILINFSQNTWGYKIGSATNYSPIPALSTPSQILKTTGKTNGDETNNLKLGMKLSEILESGSYKNKLIFSILTNNYERVAIMTKGPEFNHKLKTLETATNKIEHFKKSLTPPVATVNTLSIEDEGSDYEIKLWLDPTDNTAYYYAEPEKVYLNENSGEMFYVLPELKSLEVAHFNTENVVIMYRMFASLGKLTTLDLSNFDTHKVKVMSSMFIGSMVRNLDLSSFDTKNVQTMESMFYNAIGLENLNLSSFDTRNVVKMATMFYMTRNITNIDLSNFNTSKVTDMKSMFDGMGVVNLDISNFNTTKVTNMQTMFCNMSNVVSIDISNFETSNVENFNAMFARTSYEYSHTVEYVNDNLEKIFVKNDFNLSRVTKAGSIFAGRKKLRGGNGSALANPYYADKTWLRVDRPGVQGYFTRKS